MGFRVPSSYLLGLLDLIPRPPFHIVQVQRTASSHAKAKAPLLPNTFQLYLAHECIFGPVLCWTHRNMRLVHGPLRVPAQLISHFLIRSTIISSLARTTLATADRLPSWPLSRVLDLSLDARGRTLWSLKQKECLRTLRGPKLNPRSTDCLNASGQI